MTLPGANSLLSMSHLGHIFSKCSRNPYLPSMLGWWGVYHGSPRRKAMARPRTWTIISTGRIRWTGQKIGQRYRSEVPTVVPADLPFRSAICLAYTLSAEMDRASTVHAELEFRFPTPPLRAVNARLASFDLAIRVVGVVDFVPHSSRFSLRIFFVRDAFLLPNRQIFNLSWNNL